MKVRLKQSLLPARCLPPKQFQFHEGPIKTSRGIQYRTEKLCFNSMKVRLKRVKAQILITSHRSFNSMKVRLKQVCCQSLSNRVGFQFHEGPIKTKGSLSSQQDVNRFNSMKVRLKPIAFFSKIPLYTRGIIIQRYKNSSRKYVDVE